MKEVCKQVTINGKQVMCLVEANGKKLRFPKPLKNQEVRQDGSEIIDPKPTELRQRSEAPMTMRQKMHQMWKEFDLKNRESNEFESLQDAGDFDVDSDPMPLSGYETEMDLGQAINAEVEELPVNDGKVSQKQKAEPRNDEEKPEPKEASTKGDENE